MSDKHSLDFLLLGKTGHGKSATANTILGRREFRSSARSQSITNELQWAFSEYPRHIVKVVDSPGLEDTTLHNVKEKGKMIASLANMMGLCPRGVHVFLFVLKFGDRFTQEERDVLWSLKGILGPDFIKKHGIIVMTHGDEFQETMIEEKLEGISFKEWCQREDGQLKDLLVDCEFRCVLFNNRERDEHAKTEQVLQLLSMAEKLTRESGRYTNENFEAFAKHREEYLISIKAPQQKEQFKRNLSLVDNDIANMESKTPSEKIQLIKKAKQRYEECLEEIQKEDQGTGVYKDFKGELETQMARFSELESSINDAEKVKKLTEAIKKKNKDLQSTSKWVTGAKLGAGVGAVTGFVGVGLVLFTGGVAAVPFVSTALGAWALGTLGGAGVGTATGTVIGGVTQAIDNSKETNK